MKRGQALIALVSIAGMASSWMLLTLFSPPPDSRIDPDTSVLATAHVVAASPQSEFAIEGILESDSPKDRQPSVVGNADVIHDAPASNELFSVKYAKSTDIEILRAHEQRSEEMLMIINEYLAGEILAGRYETVEVSIGQPFAPTDKRESVRMEATPDPARGITIYKVARCDSATLPESAELHLEIVWLGQEIEARGLKDDK